ncbi:MAG TPA: helix-turn-helix transcriptional regulator [Pseudonocardiaceae bacterium]|nr:helix-turn-helix transcriptional regulator [Pseudonocardiaceae bacterium]
MEVRLIGRRLREIRHAHGTSLRAVAGLAGISPSHLSQMESGIRALDRHCLIVALADALGTSPPELTTLPVPAPGNGGTDSAIEAVRQALLAVGHQRPGGQVVPVEALRAQVAGTVDAYCRCDLPGEVGVALSGLVRDLHSSIAAGRDTAELLDLAMLLHTQVTAGWLRIVGAPVDLRAQAVVLAGQAARELDTPTALGLAAWGGLHVMITAGTFDLALAELDAVTVPTDTWESMQLAGMLAMCRSLLAAVDSRPEDVAAPFEQAMELAERTGEGNAYGMGFGPTTVGLWRMYSCLDVGDYAQAVRIGDGLHPEAHLPPLGRADYWVTYGRALARVRGRRDDAVVALQRAEEISPYRLCRDFFATGVIAELIAWFREDSVDRELRGMAHRAGLLR